MTRELITGTPVSKNFPEFLSQKCYIKKFSEMTRGFKPISADKPSIPSRTVVE